MTDDDRAAVAIAWAGRTVALKWHQLRRAAHEPPFSIANLRAALALNASVEVDVRRLADDAWICLHDDTLDRETDGSGPVAALDTAGARRRRIAGADYAPPLLTDLADAVAAAGPTAACLQLDLKEPPSGLSEAAAGSFAAAVRGIAPACVLSGYDWPAVTRLGAAVPGLRLGYDPYEAAAGRSFATAAAFERFAQETLDRAPTAHAFYLDHRFVTAALAAGVNPIAILQRNGALVDVWTLDPATPAVGAVLRRVVEAGADQITTNAPGALARLWQRSAP